MFEKIDGIFFGNILTFQPPPLLLLLPRIPSNIYNNKI
jgi:hypothetical protein